SRRRHTRFSRDWSSDVCSSDLSYLAIGIQDISNTQALFNYAKEKGVQVIKREEIFPENIDKVIAQIQSFAEQTDAIYLTVDMDEIGRASCRERVELVECAGRVR